jgi:Flp pilus assembly protein TadG
VRTTNTYLALKTFGAHVAGDRFKANEQIGAKLIRQGLASLLDDYDNEQVQLRWENESLEIYNRQTGRVLLRIPPGGITVLPVDIIGNVTGNADTATRATAADSADSATKAEGIRIFGTAPVNATDAASTTIGSGEDTEGKITVTVVKAGAGGNLYTIAVSTGGDPDCDLTATIDNKAITVELGKSGEVLDDTKNAADNVVNVINALTVVTATKDIDGPLQSAVETKNFTGGENGTEGNAGDIVLYDEALYVCTEVDPDSGPYWQKVELTELGGTP